MHTFLRALILWFLLSVGSQGVDFDDRAFLNCKLTEVSIDGLTLSHSLDVCLKQYNDLYGSEFGELSYIVDAVNDDTRPITMKLKGVPIVVLLQFMAELSNCDLSFVGNNTVLFRTESPLFGKELVRCREVDKSLFSDSDVVEYEDALDVKKWFIDRHVSFGEKGYAFFYPETKLVVFSNTYDEMYLMEGLLEFAVRERKEGAEKKGPGSVERIH